MKASVNHETCIGCGICTQDCPVVFEMNNDNLAVVIVDIVPQNAENNCKQAAEDCPVDAIEIQG